MTTELLALTGSLTLRDEAVPADCVATVKLVDGDGEVLAATAFDVSASAQYTLHVDPLTVTRPDRLFVWAAVRTPDGWWGTLELAPATGDDVVVLDRVPD